LDRIIIATTMNTFIFLYKKSILKAVLPLVFFLLGSTYVHAAMISIDAPETALGNRQPIVVRVFLDAEQDTLSGIAGDFSFPSLLFDVESIMTQGSVVSPWVIEPHLSEEKYLDSKTHVTFEGIFPGGYSGVRSPYYDGSKPGILFSVTLVPKNSGVGILSVDDITFNAFSSDAKRLPSSPTFKTISVPVLTASPVENHQDPKQVDTKGLRISITEDELINHGAHYLTLTHTNAFSAIKKIYVAETDEYSASDVSMSSWRETDIPYVLLYQDRTKYIHVKVLYANNTYTIRTLPPVENSKSITQLSRILVGVLALLFVLFFYAHSFLTRSRTFFTKKK
jgi:hypothetical protein